MADEILLTDEELDEIAGGKSSKEDKKPKDAKQKCNQCNIEGKDPNTKLYKIGKYKFCKAEYHIYKNGSYSHKSKSDVTKLIAGKSI